MGSSKLLLNIDSRLVDVDQKTVLAKLPTADGAAFNSNAEQHAATCHPDTRVDLLDEIYKWADDPHAETIFWLNGMAGTGKSTISRTVARTFAASHRLGGSFFFKRGDGDRGKAAKFFTTVAAQLVVAHPALAGPVKGAIDADPAVVGNAMTEQFENLILEPLSQTSHAPKAPSLVIVVDALDECERDADVKLIIRLFSRAKTLKSPLRVFVTSRPELHIRLGFVAIKGAYQDLVLHDIPEPVVEHDIKAYLESELATIRRDYNASVLKDRQLSADWPGQLTIQILVNMAFPLFIFAATICRFLADRKCGNPAKQLGKVIKYQTRSQESKLDATYLPVLNQLVDGLSERERVEILEDFRYIVGSIVILASPLSTCSLAQILLISKNTVDDRLDLLHSVLSVPSSDTPVRLLHLSFRDFLIDPDKCKSPFWVDKTQTHKKMAENCLRLLDDHLRADICGVKWPGIPRSTIDQQTIDKAILPEVQYACLYWVYHIEEAKSCFQDGDQVHHFLRCHFLHWLEALSLIGRASESIALIKKLQGLLVVSNLFGISKCDN
jgi:hypothetical protein